MSVGGMLMGGLGSAMGPVWHMWGVRLCPSGNLLVALWACS